LHSLSKRGHSLKAGLTDQRLEFAGISGIIGAESGGGGGMKAFWIVVGILITVVVMFLLLFFTVSKYA